MEIQITSLDQIAQAAREFVAAIGDRRVFAFYGPMGAGKTTFIKAVCEQLGVVDQVTSPTFAIVNVYEAPSTTVNHFDFYRIKRLEEACDMGCEEYFYSGDLCFIEWPELIDDILPDDTVRVTITIHPDGHRTVTL